MTIALLPVVRRHGPALAVLAACAVFMFFDLRTTPVTLWDESRNAVNALEMHLSGHLSLVTTYGFAPDLWNTKPPLLIWLMDISMSLFGVGEWAMRLPSMLAAMGTLALTLSFTRRLSGSFWTGALAAAFLATSIIFFGEHGARTADYEALLCLFTTGYLYVLFFALHRRRPGWRAPLLAGALIGLAIMSKSIAGLTPGLGVPLYLLLVGRVRRPFQRPWLLGATPVALAPAAIFYGLREAVAPGYLHAVADNDLLGRYARALDRHAGGPGYYVDGLFALATFSGGWIATAAPFALVWTRGRARLGLLYSVCIAGALLVALSFSATKLLHYAAPAAPFLCIASAIAIQGGLQIVARHTKTSRVSRLAVQATVALFLLACLARSTYFRDRWVAREFEAQCLYGELIAAASRQGNARLSVVDDGVLRTNVVGEGLAPNYSPQLDFYRELAVARGQDVGRITPRQLVQRRPGEQVGTCDARLTAMVGRIGPTLPAPPGCVLVREQ